MIDVFWNALSESERRDALKRPAVRSRAGTRTKVAKILKAVRTDGDEALRDLTQKLDGVSLESFAVTEKEIEKAKASVSVEVLSALQRAIKNIEKFHRAQMAPGALAVETLPGLRCERRAIPIETVGLYIPGGTASLPSTVLMLGVPARLAGCPSVVLCSPPRKDGSLDANVLVAADLCGIRQIFKLGGAQAVAAMAYGTESVPKVDKIFGPGNSWVTEAKLQVSIDSEGAASDLPAGPSEVLVIADNEANASFVASDLLSQAEHGEDSQVVLVTDSEELKAKVKKEVKTQLALLSRKKIAAVALKKSVVVTVSSIAQALQVSNAYAPEHLILQVADARSWARQVKCAGSVFLGPWSPESVGDYASGTNHVLPTYGYARAYSGVSMDSFVKQVTFQELSEKALLDIGPVVETLAEIEGLDAHANAVTLRLEELRRKKPVKGKRARNEEGASYV